MHLFTNKQSLLNKLNNDFKIFIDKKDYTSAFMVMKGVDDFLKGLGWLSSCDSEKNHMYLKSLKPIKCLNILYKKIVFINLGRALNN